MHSLRTGLTLLVALLGCTPAVGAGPHLILLALDDIGWADVGYHGSDFPTPNIDGLARSGLELDRMYAMPQCSPTRAALLTGRYSFHTGMQASWRGGRLCELGCQHYTTIFPGATPGIPMDAPTVAELLGKAGYDTAMVGKWHLGYSSWAQTPTRRGFDSYLGYLQGQTDYYNRTLPSCGKAQCLYKQNSGSAMPATAGRQGEAYDFWRDEAPAFDLFGQYTSDTYADRVDTLIEQHANSSSPLFLYYAEQQLHIPLELPPEPEHLRKCRGVTGGSAAVNRTVLCAMASRLDSSVGRLVETLKRTGMWQDTLIWAISDNGGMTHWGDGFPASASSNWPLRGGKATLFEGGVRSVSFMAGGALPQGLPSKYNGLLHVSDVLPTLLQAAGVRLPEDGTFDGSNAWPALLGEAGAVKRTEVPLNIDTNGGLSMVPHLVPRSGDANANFSALITWPWKLILGTTCNPGIPHADALMDGWWTIRNYSRIMPPAASVPGGQALLFNIEDDPEERHDLAGSRPGLVRNMTARVQRYWASPDNGWVRAQLNLPMPLANPRLHNWTWAPFRPAWRHSAWYGGESDGSEEVEHEFVEA